ncbi:MAG TPA: GNAT family N-acetyltransferase [Paenisporosarcina sp.]|nr:GNAT family N-acetyltransferase [Paenisporosarcina sp.]
MEYQIRKAALEDVEGIAKVHINSWRSTYKGIISDDFLKKLNIESGIKRWRGRLGNPSEKYRILIVEDDKQQIIGFIDGGKNRGGEDKYDAELYSFYLLEEVQKQGIGREMLRAFAEELKNEGFFNMIVWVLKDNPARTFYEIMGGKYLDAKCLEELSVEEVSYGWKDLRVL